MASIGTKVVISKLDRSKFSYKVNLNESMKQYAGKTATIIGKSPKNSSVGYALDIDGGKWGWTDDMFTVVGEGDLLELLINGSITQQQYETYTNQT